MSWIVREEERTMDPFPTIAEKDPSMILIFYSLDRFDKRKRILKIWSCG